MKKIAIYLLQLLVPCIAFCLEMQPWFGNVYEFDLLARYSYSYYHRVPDATRPLGYTSEDHLAYADLELPFAPYWSFDGDLQFTDTPRQSFSFRSIALQLRYLWLDDIVGDSVSLTTGFSARHTSRRSLKDISCPYHRDFDFEANFALGKEFDKFEFWRYRLWG